MGEIHYSRLPADEWRNALLKMKAGGIDVVASYAFWLHHEEARGEWDFGGCRNLGEFVRTVRDCRLYMFLRIGPWCHGEARNGGFPDWLLRTGHKLRSDDPAYLELVRAYYAKLFGQVEGLLFKDGGPIIGIQIENEYGHCGGLTGAPGEAHMRTLTKLAKDAGFDVPLYTATGWNGAVTGGLLPVMGGYCDAPWDPGIVETEPSGNYIFSHERNDTSIGSDAGIGAAVSYDFSKFPYITAELGGGLQVTKHRRVIPSAEDTAAMSVVKMGSGVNLLGYYMYHGGVNPEGRLSTLQESKESGDHNDLPVLSYDFQAPLGAYGQYHRSYHELRLLGMFAADFGGELCRMPAVIPQDNPQNLADKERFRYSFRHNGEWGFVFFCNHVRHMQRPAFPRVALTVPGLGLELPAFDVAPGRFGFYPFNMPVRGGRVKFARAVPLCRINGTTVLYGEDADAQGEVLLISRDDALRAYKIRDDMERLVISDSPVIQDGDDLAVFTEGTVRLKVSPAWPKAPDGFECRGGEGAFTVYEKKLELPRAQCLAVKVSDTRFRLEFSGLEPCYDYDCEISYTAESAAAFIDGRAVMDDFYTDGKWHIGLRRHGFPPVMEIELNPLRRGDPVYLQAWPAITGDSVCRMDGVKVAAIARLPVKVPR